MKSRLVFKKMEELKKPLAEGSSKETIGHNIKEMEASGHPHDQSVAAALNEARKSGAKIPKKTKKSEAELKAVTELVKSGLPMAQAMEKIEEEALQKMMSRPASPAGGNAVGSHDRTQANPGNPQAKMTIASAFGGAPSPKPAAPAPTAKNEDCGPAMQKRIGELVKSGIRPGEAMEKAREEFGIKPGVKLKGKLEKNASLAIKPMAKQGTPMPGAPGAMPTAGAGMGGAY